MRKYLINGQLYRPIKMGEVRDFYEWCEETCTCHDCNAKVHEEHTLGCDAERCPCCGGQFISCNCDIKIFYPQKNNKMSDLKEIKKQNDEEM